MAPMKFNAKKFYDPAAIPIIVIIGGACAGAGWYLTRLARGSDIVWDRHNNPEPWNDVKDGQQTKMYAVSQEHTGKYRRASKHKRRQVMLAHHTKRFDLLVAGVGHQIACDGHEKLERTIGFRLYGAREVHSRYVVFPVARPEIRKGAHGALIHLEMIEQMGCLSSITSATTSSHA